jgi:hypothetical protein
MRLSMLVQKFGLAVITFVLLSSFAANVYFCSQSVFSADGIIQEQVAYLRSQLSDLSSQLSILQVENAKAVAQMADLEGQAASLSKRVNSLRNENSIVLDENVNLQSQLSVLSEANVPAKLVTRIGASDMRYNYSGQEIRLYITGEVWNVGTEAAQNCRLHVVLYRGVNVAKDTYIELGTIIGGSYTEVATNIYYAGDKLTNWVITPEHG